MGRKWRGTAAALVLIALFVLSVRPIAVEAFGIRVDPQDIKLATSPNGEQHCYVASSCQTVTPSSFGMDAVVPPLLVLLGLLVFGVSIMRTPSLTGVRLLAISPPPKGLTG